MRAIIYATVLLIFGSVAYATDNDSVAFTLSLSVMGGVILAVFLDLASHAHRFRQRWQLQVRHRGKTIRFSISYLVRIRIDDLYLLVYSDRFRLFQPVGGLYKATKTASSFFERHKVMDDDKISLDDNTRGDLRRLVPAHAALPVLDWFASGQDREAGPWREFQQELIGTGLLPADKFPYVLFRWVKRHEPGVSYSVHFQRWEYKLADIFEAELTPEQVSAVRQAVRACPGALRLVTTAEIETRGVTRSSQTATIAETGAWLLD